MASIRYPWEKNRCELYGSAVWNPETGRVQLWYTARGPEDPFVDRLAYAEVGQLLSSLFTIESASDVFTQAIYRETEGKPFFIEELIKSLIEQKQIYWEEGRWQRQEIADLAIPQSIKEATGRRLNRQGPGCIEMLHTASALGKSFTFVELAVVAGQGENELLDALDEASNAQLLRVESADSYVFTHDKIREVLYEELSPIRRRRLHLRIGEGLEQLYGLADDKAPLR